MREFKLSFASGCKQSEPVPLRSLATVIASRSCAVMSLSEKPASSAIYHHLLPNN